MEWRQKGDEENYYERLNRHESRYFIFLFMSVPWEERKTERGRKAHKESLRSCLLLLFFSGPFIWDSMEKLLQITLQTSLYFTFQSLWRLRNSKKVTQKSTRAKAMKASFCGTWKEALQWRSLNKRWVFDTFEVWWLAQILLTIHELLAWKIWNFFFWKNSVFQ